MEATMAEQHKNMTVLGTDCKLNGELSLDSDAVIMGQFKGTLRVNGVLEIAETAKISGGIVAGSVRLGGTVDADILRVGGVLDILDSAKVTGTIITGNLRLAGSAQADVVAEHGIELLAGADLTGQVYTTNLSIVEGATFQGEVHVGPKAIQAAGALLRQAQEADGANGAEFEETGALPRAWAEESDEPQGSNPNIRVPSNSLSNMLNRRRAKILTGAGKSSNGDQHTGNGNGNPRGSQE
jgi:cytoskeletal protein CcmA (bactofilin family)